MGKRELVALLCLSFWFLVIGMWLLLTRPRVCLQVPIVVFPNHTRYFSCVPSCLLSKVLFVKIEIMTSSKLHSYLAPVLKCQLKRLLMVISFFVI